MAISFSAFFLAVFLLESILANTDSYRMIHLLADEEKGRGRGIVQLGLILGGVNIAQILQHPVNLCSYVAIYVILVP